MIKKEYNQPDNLFRITVIDGVDVFVQSRARLRFNFLDFL